MSGSSRQLTLKKGAPGDQVCDLLCLQLASYLERGPLMWMMPLHLHVNQKSDYDIMMNVFFCLKIFLTFTNSVDLDEMQHYAASYLGLHCWQKYLFRDFPYPKGKLIYRLIWYVFLSDDYLKSNLLKKFFQEHHHSVKRFGARSGLT